MNIAISEGKNHKFSYHAFLLKFCTNSGRNSRNYWPFLLSKPFHGYCGQFRAVFLENLLIFESSEISRREECVLKKCARGRCDILKFTRQLFFKDEKSKWVLKPCNSQLSCARRINPFIEFSSHELRFSWAKYDSSVICRYLKFEF
jgi:hypothetical protein